MLFALVLWPGLFGLCLGVGFYFVGFGVGGRLASSFRVYDGVGCGLHY